jgi:hypothetical protein
MNAHSQLIILCTCIYFAFFHLKYKNHYTYNECQKWQLYHSTLNCNKNTLSMLISNYGQSTFDVTAR